MGAANVDVDELVTDGGTETGVRERGSKFFDVATVSMSGPAREEFEAMRDATDESKTVLVVTESGVSYRVIPTDRERNGVSRFEDQLSVWGISELDHPRTGYARFKALGDAKKETVPLPLLGRLFLDRVTDKLRSLHSDISREARR